MQIVTLVDNLVYGQDLMSEHGLSMYIEAEKKILFDTGQSGIFIQNAQFLGIDIEDIDILILSHGHCDHTGGLNSFLEKNRKAHVLGKKDIFVPKYHGNHRFIGTPRDMEYILNKRFIPIDSVTEIADNVYIMPNIPIFNPTDTHFRGLTIKQDNEYVPDEFNDELFLVISHNERIDIITACSHRGITNICTTATKYFSLPVGYIIGGFHIKESTTEEYHAVTNYFRQIKPRALGVCHCTGIEKYALMYHECDMPVFYNYTGNIVSL